MTHSCRNKDGADWWWFWGSCLLGHETQVQHFEPCLLLFLCVLLGIFCSSHVGYDSAVPRWLLNYGAVFKNYIDIHGHHINYVHFMKTEVLSVLKSWLSSLYVAQLWFLLQTVGWSILVVDSLTLSHWLTGQCCTQKVELSLLFCCSMLAEGPSNGQWWLGRRRCSEL